MLQVQQPAPLFQATAVIDGFFEDIKLNEMKGKWIAFNDALPQFTALNAEVLAVSTDSAHCMLAYSNLKRSEGGIGPDLELKLVADKNMRISRDYGVLVEELGITLRGLFIIDPLGILRQMTVNDMQVGRSVAETLRLLQAYQFHDEHGDVCGADWNPSEPVGIKSNIHIRPSSSTSTSHDASPAKVTAEAALTGLKRDSEPTSITSNGSVKKPKLT